MEKERDTHTHIEREGEGEGEGESNMTMLCATDWHTHHEDLVRANSFVIFKVWPPNQLTNPPHPKQMNFE